MLTLRTLLLAACSYLPLLALYLAVAFAASGDASQAGASRWVWFPFAFLLGCLPWLWATLPFSLIELFLCRRYLRRTRVLAGSP